MGYAERLKLYISIHALLAESDAILGNPCAGCPAISIHALLAESDHWRCCWQSHTHYNFYPRSPCGERLDYGKPRAWDHKISIHALLAESDELCQISRSGVKDFYPRSPCGERRTW